MNDFWNGTCCSPRGALRNGAILVGVSSSWALVLPALLRWGCSGCSAVGARSLCPCWGRNPPFPIVTQPTTLPPARAHTQGMTQLCLSPSSPPAHLGDPLALLLPPHPSSFRAPRGRRKVSPPNKFRFNLQVKKSVFFCS